MRSVLLFLLFLALAIGSGCAQKPRSLWPDGAVVTLDRDYDHYLTGDADEARRALNHSIAFMQSADSRAHGRAHGLWLGYARLFALEKHAGHDSQASAAFETAKVWYRAKLEASGQSSQEIASALDSFTPESCLDIVRRFDAAHTKGRVPRYQEEAKKGTMGQQVDAHEPPPRVALSNTPGLPALDSQPAPVSGGGR